MSGNEITMEASERAALSCLGACSNTAWVRNTVTGSGSYGIYLSRAAPSFAPPPNADAYPSGNPFIGNDLTGFRATRAQVYLDQYSRDNYFGPDPSHGPANLFGGLQLAGQQGLPLGAYVDNGTNNVSAHSDFSQSTLYDENGTLVGYLPGWTEPAALGAILLSPTSSYARVYEEPRLGTKYFPPGTNVCSQILSMNGTNMVFGWEKLCGNPSNRNLAEIWARWAAHEEQRQ